MGYYVIQFQERGNEKMKAKRKEKRGAEGNWALQRRRLKGVLNEDTSKYYSTLPGKEQRQKLAE